MKKKTILPLSCIIALAAAVIAFFALNGSFAKRAPVMAEFYVNTDGSDDGNGGKDSPFATLGRARDAVREISSDMTGDIVVHIAGGEYALSETLSFDERDGATNGFSIRYVGEGNAMIWGGEKLGGFELFDEEKDIWRAKVPDGASFRQLYLNGEKMIRSDTEHGYKTRIVGASRFLADGTLIPEWNNNWGEETLLQADHGEIYLRSCEFPEFKNVRDVELHVLCAWTKSVLRVDSVERDREVAILRIQEPENALIFNRMHPDIDGYSHMNTHAFAYYLENAYELIDWYGEWYHDRSDGMLYIKAPENTDMTCAEAVYPKLETLVRISSESGEKIKNLSFENLTFACTNWTLPSDRGFVEVQAGMYANRCVFKTNDMSVSRPPAAVWAADTENFAMLGCTVEHAGAAGIDLNRATLNSVIRDCTVRDIAGSGIMIGQFAVDENTDIHVVYEPDDETQICTGDRIVNNLVTRIGTEYEGSVGIAAGYPRDILIACNEVSYAPYTGISVGYGWSEEDNAMRHNRIRSNEIHHTSEMLCDAGGIYTLSKQPDSEIVGNYIHDIHLPDGADYATSGIYMDEQTAGFTVKDNVIYHAWGVGRNANGENDYRENRIYIDRNWDIRTWRIMLNAGRKTFYGFFEKTHFG
ncbi:MAG: right-handed parallel beta-helix repeat-containing protein [Clostridia bacterium]|nr:right-handed parallel beta-helix repeat-containing protein [Clostridia bacterium]